MLTAVNAEPWRAEPRLQRYVQFLVERNRHVNLTGARDEEAVWEHVADSLSLAPYVRSPLIDIGSGAGFPALVLAIVCGVTVTLIESVGKKARFLQEAAAAAEIEATVLNARAEDVGRDAAYRARFASATARAVGVAPAVLELAFPFLRIGGVALLQRGTLEEPERTALCDAALMLGGAVTQEIVLGPSDAKRIVCVTKTSATPARFPRRAGVPQSRPLCLD